jgi:hypothetical protein
MRERLKALGYWKNDSPELSTLAPLAVRAVEPITLLPRPELPSKPLAKITPERRAALREQRRSRKHG